MRTNLFLLLMLCLASSCKQQNAHQDPTHNFTVQRLLILNDQNEVLMSKEKWVWAPPSLLYNQRQHLKEGLDSLSNAYGVKINSVELRGQFGFKYDYHPYATFRNYYVARYESGKIKIPPGFDDVEWVPMEEAIDRNTVTAIKQISNQVLKNPDIIWGGSFMVSHVGDDHPTKMTEDFYPIYQR